jgi:hypothetical protein
MRIRHSLTSLSAFAVVISLLAAASWPRRDADRPGEVPRLRAHFDSVLGELRAADLSSLSASQRSARAELVERLERYSAAGRFPHNHQRPGQRVPVFRDEHGTLCAMAYLIASTGRTDIVNRVAAGDNLGYIPELARDAALRAWLDSAGLTVAEAARIQPQYEGGPCLCPTPDPLPNERSRLQTARRDYAVASAVATPFAGASMFLNLAARDASAARVRVTTLLGLGVGAGQLAYGVAGTTNPDSRRNIGVANIAVGSAAMASAVWRMRRPVQANARTASVRLVPFVTTDDAGLTLSLRM